MWLFQHVSQFDLCIQITHIKVPMWEAWWWANESAARKRETKWAGRPCTVGWVHCLCGEVSTAALTEYGDLYLTYPQKEAHAVRFHLRREFKKKIKCKYLKSLSRIWQDCFTPCTTFAFHTGFPVLSMKMPLLSNFQFVSWEKDCCHIQFYFSTVFCGWKIWFFFFPLQQNRRVSLIVHLCVVLILKKKKRHLLPR